MSLIEQYRQMHQAGHFPGFSMKKHLDEIHEFVDRLGARSLLDYGSGKGEQWKDPVVRDTLLKPCGPIESLHLYEPAIPPMKYLPKYPMDVVLSTDVLEHIPEDEIHENLKSIFKFARKGVFLSICCRPAKKTLPNGMNAHVTIRPEIWWLALLDQVKPEGIELEIVWND